MIMDYLKIDWKNQTFIPKTASYLIKQKYIILRKINESHVSFKPGKKLFFPIL